MSESEKVTSVGKCQTACCFREQVTAATVQTAATNRKDAASNAVPPKMPRFEKSSSVCSISDDSLTKHLTALWEREDATAPPVTATPPLNRAGVKRKAASVSSYLSATKPDPHLQSPDTSRQPDASTILSQLLSSCAGVVSSPTSFPAINSIACNSPRKNVAAMQKNAKQPSVVNPSGLQHRWSSSESVSASNLFRLPTYEQVIGNRAALSSPVAKSESVPRAVFHPSPQASTLSSVVSRPADDVSSVSGANSQSAANNAAIAGHIQLDDCELLRQLEQILSEPGLSVSDIDSVLGGCVVVPPSLPQSLSAFDRKAISLIQSQLMSMETSSSTSLSSSVASQSRTGTLCHLLGGTPPLVSDASSSKDKSVARLFGSLPSADSQLLLSADAFRTSHSASG